MSFRAVLLIVLMLAFLMQIVIGLAGLLRLFSENRLSFSFLFSVCYVCFACGVFMIQEGDSKYPCLVCSAVVFA